MNRRKVDTLVVDLDNTLFDWFALWYASFRPIYDEIILKTKLSEPEVQLAIRKVHQNRRTSEYTFLLEEIDVLEKQRNGRNIREVFENSIAISKQNRDKNLKLYPGVLRGLWEAKSSGTKIIAYTESMAFYSSYRLKRVGLDGVIDVLFSPEDHDKPNGVSMENFRNLPDEFYELQVTENRHTPRGELKPNPKILLDILNSIGADPTRCAYVGDSLFKDMAMARDVGVFDIHAKYGESQKLPEYALLQKVSHWTEEDVVREKAITDKGADFTPSVILHESFSEIFMYCDFTQFNKVEKKTSDLPTSEVIDVWKKCVDVQQHFNDLEMRIRNFAITVVGALVASISFTYQQGLEMNLFGFVIPAAIGLVIAAIFAWTGFYFMDRHWYHVLLKGAVIHAGTIEEKYREAMPELSLGKTISKHSGEKILFGIKFNSDRRLTAFYVVGFVVLSLVFAVLIFAKADKVRQNSQIIDSTKPVTVIVPVK